MGNRLKVRGGSERTHDFLSLPLLVRPNTALPIGAHTDKPDYDYSHDITLRLYQIQDGKSIQVEIPSVKGGIETSFQVVRKGTSIHIRKQGPTNPWNVALIGIPDIKVTGIEYEIIDGSAHVKLDEQVNEVHIELT